MECCSSRRVGSLERPRVHSTAGGKRPIGCPHMRADFCRYQGSMTRTALPSSHETMFSTVSEKKPL